MKRLLILALLCLPPAASADSDHDAARRALENGEVLPLAQILAIVQDRFSGHVIDVEFERKHGVYVYEFKLITGEGRMVEVKVDAATGRIVDVEEKDD